MISLIDKNALKVLAEDFTRAENLSESASRRLLLTLQVAFRLGQTDEQNLGANSVSTPCEDQTGYFGRVFVAVDHEPNPHSSIGIAYANSEVALASVNSDHCFPLALSWNTAMLPSSHGVKVMNRLFASFMVVGFLLSPLVHADEFHTGVYGMCGANKIIGFKLARAGQIVIGQELIHVLVGAKDGSVTDVSETIPVSGHIADDQHTLMLTLGDASTARTVPMSATYHDGKLDGVLQGVAVPMAEFTERTLHACIAEAQSYALSHPRN